MANFEDLKGKILIDILQKDNEIIFTCEDGSKYKMYHEQDCCESVFIEDIAGDLNDLLRSEILLAEERTNSVSEDDENKSITYTFYTIRTHQTSVDIRWYGSSNGYYSESVDFIKL